MLQRLQEGHCGRLQRFGRREVAEPLLRQHRGGQLAAALTDETIKDLAVRPDGARLRVEARILESAAAEQGIDLILLIGTAGKAGEEPQNEVVCWSWWRAPFDYEAQADSVWEG